MARKVWVVERETRKRWGAYEVYLYRSWAQTNMKTLSRMYPGAKWRIVRYVPEAERDALRTAVADYMCSEGCSCCQNTDDHEESKAVIAKLLKVPKYKDRSGYDFYRFRTERG